MRFLLNIIGADFIGGGTTVILISLFFGKGYIRIIGVIFGVSAVTIGLKAYSKSKK